MLTLNWGDGRVDIVACSLKTGGGKLPVDNLHLGGGVGAGLDLDTGLICTYAKPWVSVSSAMSTTSAPILSLA